MPHAKGVFIIFIPFPARFHRFHARVEKDSFSTSRNETGLYEPICKTKYKMSPSSVRSEGGEAAAGYCLNLVSYRVDEAVKYNVLNSD